MLSEASYANQLWFLTHRAFKVRYTGTTLGILWAVALPLLQIIIYVVVFGFLFKSKLPGSDTTLTYVIWFLLGYSPWMFFSECLTNASSCMQSNSGLIKSFPFRKALIVYSAVLSSLPQLFLCLIISAGLILVTGSSIPAISLFYQCLGLANLFLIIIVSSLCFSLLGLVVRDLTIVLPQLLMMLLFASPVFFPASVLPKILSTISQFNPLIVAINLLRAPIQEPTASTIVLAFAGIPLGLLVWRIILKRFQRYEGFIPSLV